MTTVTSGGIGGGPRSLVPLVLCPFRPAISPHACELDRISTEWAARYGLIPGGERPAFVQARFARLMARAYPQADLADLALASAWLVTVFALDDLLESELGRQPRTQRELSGRVLAHLRGETGPQPMIEFLGAPIGSALAAAWHATMQRTGRAWQQRFRRNFGEYLAGNAWEAANRRAGRAPGLDEYVRMRRRTAATAIFFDLIEVVGGTELPPAAAVDPALARLRRHADNVIAWFNDLVSWPKELRRGDAHNLVLVLALNQHLDLATAIDTVVKYHDEQMRAFILAGSRIPTDSPLAAMVPALAAWVRANVDWSCESGRYGTAVG